MSLISGRVPPQFSGYRSLSTPERLSDIWVTNLDRLPMPKPDGSALPVRTMRPNKHGTDAPGRMVKSHGQNVQSARDICEICRQRVVVTSGATLCLVCEPKEDGVT